jgi:hypothetical protein
MFNFGLCDLKQKAVIQDYCDRTVKFIAAGNMTAAFDVWDEMLNGKVIFSILWTILFLVLIDL